MSFLVEDGTGVSGANSYVSVASADTYHSDRGNDKWSDATTPQKQAALIYATAWIDEGPFKWYGDRAGLVQDRLKWPRTNADHPDGVVFTGIPPQLSNAICELALAHLTKALNEVLARGGELSSVWVGPITVSWNDWASAQRKYPMVFRLLRPLHSGMGNLQRRLVRG